MPWTQLNKTHWTPLNETELCGFKIKSAFDLCVRPKVRVKALSKGKEYTNNEMDLYLTSPIVTAWTYQLAYSLHTGN